MALLNYKKVLLPKLEFNLDTDPLAKFPDPLENVRFGAKEISGVVTPFIYRDGNLGLRWYEASADEILINIKPFQNKSVNFFSMSDAAGIIEDANLLGREVLMINFPDDSYLEGIGFEKPVNEDTIISESGFEIPSDTNCLLTLSL